MLQILSAIVALSSMQHAGWHKVESDNTFDSVAVTRELHNDIVSSTHSAEFWGTIGPKAVFRAWNSGAYDPEENILYFHGGGHSDYGGNEIYAYNIDNLSWSRVNDPAPLLKPETHSQIDDLTIYLPNEGPISAHSYDAFVWNPVTKSIWMTSSAHGFGGGHASHTPTEKTIWEFIPSTNKWKKHAVSNNFSYPMGIYIKSSEQVLMVGRQGRDHHATLFDKDGTEHVVGAIHGLDGSGVSSLFANPDTGEIYSSHSQGIYKLNITGTQISAEKVTDYPNLENLHFSMDYRQASFNYRAQDGKFYIWNGGPQFVTWSPESNQFNVIWNDRQSIVPSHGADGAGKVFDKFVYIAEEDLFFGLTNGGEAQGSDGMWAWRPLEQTEQGINQADFGDITLDGITQTSASFFVPMLYGDRNYNSKVRVHYRVQGQSKWHSGIELLRLRPEFISNSKNRTGISAEGFAGIVTGLQADTRYEFKFSLSDPDVGKGVSNKQISATTASQAGNLSIVNKVVVASASALNNALENAEPGDTIQLLPGTYHGEFILSRSGTANAPITLTGTQVSLSKIDATGKSVGIQVDADHVVISNINIAHAKTGISLQDDNRTDVAIIGNHIEDVIVGIAARGGHRQLYINNNLLEGRVVFGDVSSDTWNFEGIVVTGHNIEISQNTLSGFGDSIGMHWRSSLANVSINIHHNLVLWGGDDGIEFDFTLRNVAAHHNLISNTANGLSFQPVWGGPALAHHNIVLNPGRGPVKIKPEQDSPSGILLYNNTFIKDDSEIKAGGDEAWKNASGSVKQLFAFNNLFVSPADVDKYVLKNTSSYDLTQMDYNGWTADGRYSLNLEKKRYGVNARNFEEWQGNGSVGMHDHLLNLQQLFASYQPAFDNQQFSDYRQPMGAEFHLNPDSPAVDGGVPIFGINYGFRGEAPDLGALEVGEFQPVYGASIKRTPIDTVIIVDDIFSMTINTSAIFSPLDNDIAPLGETLRLISVDQPANGLLNLQKDDRIEFIPDADFVGQVMVTYRIEDSESQQFTGNIRIDVNHLNRGPQAVDDVVQVKQGESTTISFSTLLENDTDPDGDVLSIKDIGEAKQGSIKVYSDSFSYQPKAGFIGKDTIAYQIEDAAGLISQAQLKIDVVTDGTIIGSEYRDNIDVGDRKKGVTILGNGGADIIVGSQGDDIIAGGQHQDRLSGGSGDDVFMYFGKDDSTDWIDGGSGYNSILGDNDDNIIGLNEVKNIANINGKSGKDIILGGDYRQQFDFSATKIDSIELIDGGQGHDLIIGSQGDDVIKGGAGNDFLDGQKGTNTAVYNKSKQHYRIESDRKYTYVIALDADEGVDTLVNIGLIRFSDNVFKLSQLLKN